MRNSTLLHGKVNDAMKKVSLRGGRIFALMMLLLSLTLGAKANPVGMNQTRDYLTVYDGSVTNSYVPVYGFYTDAYLKCEYIMPAAELTEMADSDINAVTYYLSNLAAADWGAAYFQVFMKEVDSTTINTYQGMDGATLVYEGPLDGTQAEMNITFTTPYHYYGGNLLVGIYNVEQGTYKSCSFYGESVSGASVQGYSYNGLDSISPTQRNFIPKTTFYYSNGNAVPNLVTTPDPIDLGYRPNGAWMRPLEVNIFNEGIETTINNVAITNNDYFLLSLEGVSVPFTLGNNDGFDLNLGTVGSNSGTIDANLIVNYGDNEETQFDVFATAYTPVCPDVWEVAQLVTTFPYTATLNANSIPLYDNYRLPPTSIVDGADAVYKLVFTEDTYLNASVTNGENGKVALYPEDFNGVGGPDLGNSYTGPQIGGNNAPFTALIGEGTSTSGYFPFYCFYNYSLSQQLFLNTELMEAGVTCAPMNSISWYCTSTNDFLQSNITIWMANVEETAMTSTTMLTANMTKVYEGDMTPAVGWNEFVFNQGSFAWDGNSNILVSVQRNNGAWASGVNWQVGAQNFTCSVYKYTDSTGAGYGPFDMTTNAYSGTTSTNRANTIFKSVGRRSLPMLSTSTNNRGVNTNTSLNRDGWLYYDNGVYGTSIGVGGGIVYWGSMFPASMLSENNLTKVALYENDYNTDTITLYVYQGGSEAPGTLVYSQTFTPVGGDQFHEVNLSNPVTIDPSQNLWIMFSENGTYPANACEDTGYANNRWVSLDGDAWYDIADLGIPGYGWMIRAYIEGNVSNGTITDMTVTPGTYYLVASSTSDEFTVEINTDEVPCPELATNPSPADAAMEVSTAVNLSWNLDSRATEYRLMFGTTYYCEDTLVDWTDNLAEHYLVFGLNNNTNYFWRIDQRNDGCPEGVLGQIWGFTTHLNVPQNLIAVDETVFNDEIITLNWNAVADRAYQMYNVYRDGEYIGYTTPNDINATTFIDGPLPYNMVGYTYYVTAVYEEGESLPSNTVTVTVSGYGNVNGHVYEQDGITSIANATVTMIGHDEFGINRTFDLQTNDQGYYSGLICAGNYHGTATHSGYQEAQHGYFTITYNELTSDINFVMDEVFTPVAQVVAEYYPDAQNTESPYVKVRWEAMSNSMFDFDDNTMQGWTSIDADGDGYGWEPSSAPYSYFASSVNLSGHGHNASEAFVVSGSYSNNYGVLYPDNYLVSPQITLGGTMTFYACAQDESYPAEHFGVAVSTTSMDPNAFTMLNEWTMTAKSFSDAEVSQVIGEKRRLRGIDNRAQGNWHQYTVDLSAYSGMGYVAIRHFNCNDQFVLDIDDISISESSKAALPRAFSYYRVYRTDAYNYGPYSLDNTEVIASGVQDTLYIDVSWSDVERGVYKWGVSCVYEGNRGEEMEGEINWSEPIAIAPKMANRNQVFNFEDGQIPTDWVNDTTYPWVIATPGYAGYNGTYCMMSGNGGIANSTSSISTTVDYAQDGTVSFLGGFWGEGSNDSYDWDKCRFYIDDSIMIDYGAHDAWENVSFEVAAGNHTFTWTYKKDGSVNPTGDAFFVDDIVFNVDLQKPRESEIVWSNSLDKDMYLMNNEVNITVMLNSGDSPEGVTVSFINLNPGEQQLHPMADIILDGTGYYAWDSFRRGDYEVTVSKEGYSSINANVSIWDATSLSYMLEEMIPVVSDLYVSSTGWAMWDYTLGDSFSFGFEEGLPEGWTIIDANGDGYTWVLTSDIPATWTYYASLTLDWYHDGSNAICSGSYINGVGALSPDEYLISPLVNLTNSSQLSFWVAATDAGYAADHFGVFVSTTGTNPSDFTSVQEWTLTAKSEGKAGGSASRDGRGSRLATWYNYTVDLSSYAGQAYIAFHHFNCTDQYIMCLDDIELTFSGDRDRHLEYSQVVLTDVQDNVLFSGNTTDPFIQLPVDDLVEGETYRCKVASIYSTGMTGWSEVDWVYQACDNYEGANSIFATTTDEGNLISWEFLGNMSGLSNNLSANAHLLCLDDATQSYAANINAGTGEVGPDYGCLYSTPNPSWYYMKIDNPGNINVYMHSEPSVDIDFCCWGPFDDPVSPCPDGLTSDKIVDCSYSASWNETCHIPETSQSGEYYILLLTNYSNQVCDFYFEKQDGTGTTVCEDYAIGTMIFRDGEWLGLSSGNSYLDEGETGNHQYTIRMVYGGPAVCPDNNIYYSMSCPQTTSVEGEEVTQVSNFSQGYNWWSTYIEQNGIDGLGMLQEGLGSNGVTIRSQASGYTDNYPGYGWYGSLSSINNESSYRVITNAPCTVTMTGNPAVPSQHPITLGQGWTWIGYVPSTTMSVDVAMSGVDAVSGDKLKSQQGYSDYYEGYGWFGSLSTIEPGMGLMYYSTNGNPVSFTYPDSGRSGELKQNLTAEHNHWVPNVYAYPDNMTVMAVVELNDEELGNENYELAAFAANGECRGSVKLTYAEPLHRHVAFLTISGKDAAELSFRLYDTEKGVEYYDAEESLDFNANAIVGDASDLYVVHFRGTTDMDEFANKVKVYPNPVASGNRFSIGMNTDIKSPVRVEIVNALGTVVSVETSTQAPASVVAPITAGVYTLRITVEGKGTAVRKLVVK